MTKAINSISAGAFRETAPRALFATRKASIVMDAFEDVVNKNVRHRMANWNSETIPTHKTDNVSTDDRHAVRLHHHAATSSIQWAAETENTSRMSCRAFSSGQQQNPQKPKEEDATISAIFLRELSKRTGDAPCYTKDAPKRGFSSKSGSSGVKNTPREEAYISASFLKELTMSCTPKPSKRSAKKTQPCWSVDGQLYIP